MQNLHGRHISKFKLRNIEWSEKVIYNIENCITKGLNKIKGWAFLEDRESEKSKIYLCFFFNRKKLGKRILPLIVKARADVANTFNDKRYLYCGFESYMPSVVIENQANIIKAELLISNNNSWGHTIIYENKNK